MNEQVLENLKVVKRNGKKVNFDTAKVAIAIKKGFDGIQKSDEEETKYTTKDVQKIYQNAIVTDIGAYNEESMKVIEENGILIKISKQIKKEEALGNSIDVYKFSAEAGEKYFDICKEYIEERKELKLWSEVALNDTLSKIHFKACKLDGRWVEIDNHEDLALAEEIFKN